MPDSKFMTFWNLYSAVLLLYTAIFIPYHTAFYDELSDAWNSFNLFIDFCFITDIFINFFAAREDMKKGLITSHKTIAFQYLTTWFFLDLTSSIPTEILEMTSGEEDANTNSVKLLRLARLPRLYRLLRILRLFKMLRLIKHNKSMKKVMDLIRLNSGVMRMITVTITVFFMVHIIACLWFLAAKFDNFNPHTWVVRKGYIDRQPLEQYLAAVYWAFSTLTTVGFGDINAETIPEKVIAIMWMIFGVGFYSFTIGNLSKIIASIDIQAAILSQKITILNKFAISSNLPPNLIYRIKRHLEYNNKHQNNLEEQEKLLNDLPASLRSEVVSHTHGEIIKKVFFFKDKDPDFLWAILPSLRPIKLMPFDTLYAQGDHADEIYFIKKGRVKLFLELNEASEVDEEDTEKVAIIAYVEGSYFGDSDIFARDQNKGRDTSAKAELECHLLVLKRKDLFSLMEDFQDIGKEMRIIAHERKANHDKMIE
mmetsp:Transcript_24313/g.23924  ORF Transcript_24313/g.23924 Transcript_24313/m.23924 type:complete len:481 (+) Transcript_24313:722-2164(+)